MLKTYNYNAKLGIIGGGQLGRMMAYRASLLGFYVSVYSDSENSPATIFSNSCTIGSYFDKKKLEEFSKENDFVTIEFENINSQCLQSIENLHSDKNSKLNPNSNSIYITQNRLREKTFLQNNKIPTVNFSHILSFENLKDFFFKHKSLILKTSNNGYDGKGQYKIETEEDLSHFTNFDFLNEEYIAEKLVDLDYEFSVILTKGVNGDIAYFPSTINIHENGILSKSVLEKQFQSSKQVLNGKSYATNIANALSYVGTIAVEFFVLKNESVLVNEIAPRPHNSGHYTIDLCNVCQFENHVRAVTGLPLIIPQVKSYGQMVNLIGDETISLVKLYMSNPSAKIHLYGKHDIKPNRKMGHITIANC